MDIGWGAGDARDIELQRLTKTVELLTQQLAELQKEKNSTQRLATTDDETLLYLESTARRNERTEAANVNRADEAQWRSELDTPALHRMAKAVGKVIGGQEYHGDPNPTMFSAWCDSIRSLILVYGIAPGPAQVTVASWFLKGRAGEWWAGVRVSKRYIEMNTVDKLFAALQLQFQPHDAFEQSMTKWSTLKQTRDVTTYMDEVDRLHFTQSIGPIAEFGHAFKGLRPELRGVVRRALADRQVQWLTLTELRSLARSAEIEKFESTQHRGERKVIQRVFEAKDATRGVKYPRNLG